MHGWCVCSGFPWCCITCFPRLKELSALPGVGSYYPLLIHGASHGVQWHEYDGCSNALLLLFVRDTRESTGWEYGAGSGLEIGGVSCNG